MYRIFIKQHEHHVSLYCVCSFNSFFFDPECVPPQRLFNNSDFIIRVKQRVGHELNGTISIRIVILKFQKMGQLQRGTRNNTEFRLNRIPSFLLENYHSCNTRIIRMVEIINTEFVIKIVQMYHSFVEIQMILQL